MRRRMLAPIAVIVVSLIVIVFNVTNRTRSGMRPLRIRPELEPPDPTEELEDLAGRIDEVKAEIEESRAAAERRTPADDPDPPEPVSADEPSEDEWPEVPRAILEAGARLGVAPPTVSLAFRLNHAARERIPFEGGWKRLESHGADGFRALLAVIRGGRCATWQRGWLRKLYEPGLERHLLDLAEDPDAGQSRSFALWLLGIADTPEVRNYLVSRAQRATSAWDLYHLAKSLGDLAEPRGAAAFEGKFAKEGFGGVRGEILRGLGRMGGPDAKRILVDYLRTEHADRLGSAARALAEIDPAAAKEEAARLLASPDAGLIPGIDQRMLRAIAEE